MSAPRIEPEGDAAFRVEWDDAADVAFDPVALACAEHLVRARPAGVLDAVPGVGRVLVAFDPLAIAPDDVLVWLQRSLAAPPAAAARPPRTIELPVRYDADDPEISPDLAALAADKELTVDELVARHVAPTYRCAMLGFRPGFPYLVGLDPTLVAPRLATPRPRVPAGAVGIGGPQTGVYPVASPGGWRIIGRTTARLFDPDRPEPFLVHPGDLVRFVRQP